ncbi:sensor histidine kinase [Leifsonia sp. Leaf336]|uniref:sensor histidine kinase n=1 Tax=Leifsonia sp. Leaf336 TaxID=1736341 RepID=UPI001F2C08DB|nr:ATP-binding protein [Leifsonia sp. Leaf336]
MVPRIRPVDVDDAAATVDARVADALIRELRVRGSALATDSTVAAQLRAQVHVVLRRTRERLGAAAGPAPGGEAAPSGAAPASPGSKVGRDRARQNIHPADSLIAATLLFDIALAELATGDSDPAEVARALNASIMDQVVPASLTYVDVLIERLAVAHTEERLGISRELHDRVAHSIAAGIQRVQLSRQHEGAASERIDEALRLLEAALDETRSLALDLRHSVGDKHLDEAIHDYVADLSPEPPTVDAHSYGTARSLPTGVQEEAFIIVREVVHNARRHSRGERIRLESHWLVDRLIISVSDDGIGFERDRIRPGALGLIAAQERAELIGAELTIASTPGSGTTVTLTISEPGGRR